MKQLNSLDFILDDSNFDILTKVASDELSDITQEVFFFGQVVDDNDWILAEYNSDVDSYYAQCPACGSLFELQTKPENYEAAECTACGHNGTFYDFRDESLPLDKFCEYYYALLESFGSGYVLRLFNVGLTYAEREYDNYTTLSARPLLSIYEAAREYWCEGKTSCWVNQETSIYEDPDFKEVAAFDDGEYYIINYANDFDPMWSDRIEDNDTYDPKIPFLKTMTRALSYKTFKTLKKYGFESLVKDYISAPFHFADSSKITEVLGLDYNRLKAQMDLASITIADVLAAREVIKYGLTLSAANIQIMIKLMDREEPIYNGQNIRRLFKYLRNQISRRQTMSRYSLAGDYSDYIAECKKLGYDLSSPAVLYPSDLPLTHRRTSALVKLENSQETIAAVREVYHKYSGLCQWSDGKLSVVMPASCAEIIEEGAVQNHCVGNYCERVAKGEDIILFIRRAENLDKSFYTLEIRPNLKKLDVVQCQGFDNKDESPEASAQVKAFLSRYTSWFNKRKTKVVNDMRRIYYKAVKKTADSRYVSIWDGITEYKVGFISEMFLDVNPDRVAVKGLHLASLEFAQKFGSGRSDVAILEVEVNLSDVVIPDAKDQIRAGRGRILREVPMEELGEWGAKHLEMRKIA